MKLLFKIVVLFCLTFILPGIIAAITKCYKCNTEVPTASCADPVNISHLLEETCGAEPPKAPGGATPAPGASVAPTAAAPAVQMASVATEADQLVEREEAATVEWKCAKIVGLDSTSNTNITLRQCLAGGCSKDKFTTLKDVTCEDCDKNDLCNLSDQINPIGWTLLLITTICIALEN